MQKEAKLRIAEAKDKKLEPPSPQLLSALNAMANNQMVADVEDYFPAPIAAPVTSPTGLRLAAVRSGVWKYQPCQGKGEQYINAEPTKNCTANPLGIAESTYKFLNGSEETHFKGLTNENVCDHYRQRFEHMIRRTIFIALQCKPGEVRSVVRGPSGSIERLIKFNSSQEVESVAVGTPNGSSTLIEFKDNKPVRFTHNSEKLEISRMSTGHPFYPELARLKLESAELISCCEETDSARKTRCQAALSGN